MVDEDTANNDSTIIAKNSRYVQPHERKRGFDCADACATANRSSLSAKYNTLSAYFGSELGNVLKYGI